MNRDQKAQVIEEVAAEIREADAVLAVDFRGISVKQSADLRARLQEAGATFRVVKNRLTQRAADQAGAEALKGLLEGPTAFAFVRGDAAVAAKALAGFRRETQRLEFKGGTMDGDVLTAADVDAIARLPAREALYGQLVAVTASPLTGLVRGLAGLLQGLAIQLGQIHERGLIGEGAPGASGDGAPGAEGAVSAGEEEETPAGGADDASEEPAPPEEEPGVAAAEEEPAPAEEASAEEPTPAEEAPGAPAAEAETAAQEEESSARAPSEGE